MEDPLRTSPTFHQVNPDKGYRRSHIGPPPQPDKPAAFTGGLLLRRSQADILALFNHDAIRPFYVAA